MKRPMPEEKVISQADIFLKTIRDKLPAVDSVLNDYEDVSLGSYLETFTRPPVSPFQDRQELFDAICQYSAPLLGENLAERACRDLAANPVVLTTNHHGVDYFSQSVQGSILFALRSLSGISPATTITILAVGNVPLNNASYPRGVLLYPRLVTFADTIPHKMPIFPDRMKRQMVFTAPPIDNNMVSAALKRLRGIEKQKDLTPEIARTMISLLQKEYSRADIAKLPDYSSQSVVLNDRLWSRMFANVDSPPKRLYLEFESVAGILLQNDLYNPESLVQRVLFHSQIRERVLANLDKTNGCWNRSLLGTGVASNTKRRQAADITGGGTMFFWGVDSRGRRIPLCIEGSEKPMLRGIDDRGHGFEILWAAEELAEGLRQKRLIPSLFTCFLSVAFARGVNCIGGYFQNRYLPDMQRGLVDALDHDSGDRRAARCIGEVSTGFYLDSMIAVASEFEGKYLIPAGPVEMIAGGGLKQRDVDRILSLSVSEAHLLGIFETIGDAVSPATLEPGWQIKLSRSCHRILRERVPVLLSQ